MSTATGTPRHRTVRPMPSGNAHLPPPDDRLEIDVEELRALLDEATAAGEGDRGFTLVDCREEDEFAICRIAGAVLLPLSGFPDNTAGLRAEPGRPVVVYCHHGMRSQHAALFLREAGVRMTFSLSGGIDAWSRIVDPSTPRY